MAWVGQVLMQALHFPHWLGCLLSSFANGRLVKISPRKKYDPDVLFINKVFLPIQPNPAFSATAFSRSGALSVTRRDSNPEIFTSSQKA